MSAESPRHARSGGPLTVPSQPPSDRSIIDAVSGFINDVTLSSSSNVDPKDVIQWARFETADINEPTPEGDGDNDISPLLLILGYGAGIQVWLIPPSGDAQEVLSWRQGTVRVLRILPTPQHGDCFASKRPLIALCDSASPGPTFCSLSFISIRGGEQVKSIKFKNPILDVLANKRSVVVSFSERFAVFDAATLEDRMAVTTCYPCPCPLGGSAPINPLTLGDRWLAYADKKLNPSKRSSGGCEGEGVSSYTATVLHAAKSLSKGLRGLGESVAHSLAGGRSTSQSPSPPHADIQQPGVVTVLDIEGNDEEDCQDVEEPYDPIVAHFIAHSEAIIALKFDTSGMLLVTADRRGHDFHVFRINPHPCGPSLASVHHLYILHRGDTTAKVQDIAISAESRWAAVSTLRGTTHVFPISPYGGACGVRTHTQPRVVNRLSRFHRSAGLPIHAAAPPRSGSPVGEGITQGAWYPNPRLPPYPLPTTVQPLAQLRPTANLPTHTITRTSSGRQRLSSLSEDANSAPLLARARFGVCGARASHPPQPAAAPALYLMAANGCLVHLILHPRPARNVPKEKICDESPIELEVEPIAQWPLQRPPAAADLLAPLPPSNPLLQPLSCRRCADVCMSEEERWLSQVEIVTHAGPHRRLWMGPQFVFKTYNCTGSSSSLSEAETVEVETTAARSVARSNPVNMPGVRPIVPVLIDSGSASSLEHSPSDSFRRKSLLAESGRAASVCDVQLKEDLAEAMKEDHVWPREERRAGGEAGVARAVGPLGTVVPTTASVVSLPTDDVDDYTLSNEDEACFRPVVRAPASLPLQPDMIVRPLPRETTIPVQTVEKFSLPPQATPMSLDTHVVIPAALTSVTVADNPVKAFEFNHVDSEFIPANPKCDSRAANINQFVSVDLVQVDKLAIAGETSERRKTIEPIKRIAPKDVTVVKDNVETKQTHVNKDLRRREYDEKKRDCVRERDSAKVAERESVDATSLPKSNQVSDDIQPTAKARVKKSPTPKSVCDRYDSNFSVKDKKSKEFKEPCRIEERRERSTSRDKKENELKQTKDNRGAIEAKRSKDIRETKATKEIEQLKESKDFKIGKDIKAAKSNKVVKEVTPEKEVIVKEESKGKDTKECKEFQVVKGKEVKKDKELKEFVLHKEDFKESQEIIKPYKDKVIIEVKEQKVVKPDKELQVHEVKKTEKHDLQNEAEDEPSVAVTLKLPTRKELCDTKTKKRADDIKTEEQAWDLLLNKPKKQNTSELPLTGDKSTDDSKLKSKKCRKIRKDDVQEKSGEDNFIEIHTIEDKQYSKDGLVSISIPYQKMESSYVNKLKKSRSKSRTPERKQDDDCDKKVENWLRQSQEQMNTYELRDSKINMDTVIDIETLHGANSILKPQDVTKRRGYSDALKVKTSADGTASESTSLIVNDPPKSKKSKSLSPYPESCRKSIDKSLETQKKDVYVINTTKDDFPEIQITRGKPRKRSPQPTDKSSEEKESVIEKPVKSWSSIAAASKSGNKVEEVEKKVELIDVADVTENPSSSKELSLQDKLIELCKRTDIMVAECDTPTELNFVEEHHVLQDLPPLEPLDFGLDDFKLEVMRDSLLEGNDPKVTSPICKINIDDILSSIKETTNNVIESSTFNLVDLEKMPTKKEKGFSVVECHKITTQEVKLYDEKSEDNIEGMDKSSDEDLTSPLASTDSDKEDKRTTGALNLILPSSKQSVKSKKPRRKKK